MSERKFQLALIDSIRSAIVCACPNYTPSKWWECDLWAVKKSGRWTEYEIKVSVADFKADARKSQPNWTGELDGLTENKHDLLAARSVRGPSQFYYVVPDAIRAAVEPLLPEWAGLIVMKEQDGRYFSSCARVAPTLHKAKTSTREIRLAQRRMWYRYWESIRNFDNFVDRSARTSEGQKL